MGIKNVHDIQSTSDESLLEMRFIDFLGTLHGFNSERKFGKQIPFYC